MVAGQKKQWITMGNYLSYTLLCRFISITLITLMKKITNIIINWISSRTFINTIILPKMLQVFSVLSDTYWTCTQYFIAFPKVYYVAGGDTLIRALG